MVMRYVGKSFREQHKVGLRELARGAGLNKSTLVDLEKHPTQGVVTTTVARIMRYFHTRGIACEMTDLLIYEEPPIVEAGPGRVLDAEDH